ncbi:hypothetical protein [Amycolatopsis sp. H20-H5]|uniref:hypothetical protein n=1 Tax=Amycolatopsis sp. H20-H5 TaxID=3046309 RepID=UPI002DB5A3D4|nr:hypothetical protein [Amycolatopsis sp. H20-H5]MEC3978468.1 hypothetical protein [Amycolatopsis sp. H20-H5]
MTVHARRYGRHCREHFDAQGRPIPHPPTETTSGDAPPPEAVDPAPPSGDTPPATVPDL